MDPETDLGRMTHFSSMDIGETNPVIFLGQEEEARAGRISSLLWLGISYWCGDDVEKNYTVALKYYREAELRGSTRALMDLGDHYRLGLGVERDDAIALQYYEEAESKNEPRASDYVSYMRRRIRNREQPGIGE